MMFGWLQSLFGVHPDDQPPDDREGPARRERDLQARLQRLEAEVDVMQPQAPRREDA